MSIVGPPKSPSSQNLKPGKMTTLLKPSHSTSKRSRSTDSQKSLGDAPRLQVPRVDEDVQDGSAVPAFLRQTKTDIYKKFAELNWQQNLRISQGRTDPDRGSRWVQATTPYAKTKNRYINVLPWSDSRIRLKVPEGACDYINASPISLFDPRTGSAIKYIATQGPKRECLTHFWQMIWQETKDTAVIVMLTNIAEGGKEKCFQYFPQDTESEGIKLLADDESDIDLNGDVQLLECKYDEASKTTIRKLSLTIGSENRIVWHLHFIGWPDFVIPLVEDRSALLELIKLSALKNEIPTNPRIVHCSAGVGRSGTFIAMDNLLAQLSSGAIAEVKEDEDAIYKIVSTLREQRMMMVQSEEQYLYLYEVLREEFKKWKSSQAQSSGEPSPKLRRLAKGIKATCIGGNPAGVGNHSGKPHTP